MTIHLSQKSAFFIALISALFSFLISISGASLLLSLVLIVWIIMMVLLSSAGLKDHIVPLFFLISFFTFLLSREVLFEFFGLRVYYRYLATESINRHTFCCLLLSLIGLTIGFSIHSKKRIPFPLTYTKHESLRLRKISLIMYYLLMIPSALALLFTIKSVLGGGYAESYKAGNSAVPGIISIAANMETMPFYLYISTLPPKKEARVPIIVFLIYNIMTILTGRRFQMVSSMMIIIIYAFMRNTRGETWITKKHITIGCIAAPLLLVFLGLYDSIRFGKKLEFDSFIARLMDFFDQLGGSVNVIKREKYYESRLRRDVLYSFSGVYGLLFDNKIYSAVFHTTIYEGNSIAHALYGHSLSHTLSWYDYKERYLQGHGVGSCYIAELYHDFGYLGVIIGNIAYGYLLKLINLMPFNKPYICALLFSMLHAFLLAPRGGFDMFINEAFGIRVMAVFFVIMFWEKYVRVSN